VKLGSSLFVIGWSNVRKALANLRKSKALNFRALGRMSAAEIAEQIRPSGYFNQKAGYLKAFAAMLENECGESLDRLFRLPPPCSPPRALTGS